MVNEMKFYYKDYKNAIQIQGIIPAYDIDFYFSSKKQYQQFKEDYEFSQLKELKVQQALDMLPEYKKGYDAGRVEGAKEIVDLIVKQQKVYRNNLDKGESKWLEGAVDCCNYLLQLIKEKRLLELEKGDLK